MSSNVTGDTYRHAPIKLMPPVDYQLNIQQSTVRNAVLQFCGQSATRHHRSDSVAFGSNRAGASRLIKDL